LAGVPPVEVLESVHKGIVLLKLSDNKVAAVPELDVADDVRFIDPPGQTLLALDDAVTKVGT